MPIYEYACNDCEKQFEALVRSDTVPECPNCHSKELIKQLSVFTTTAISSETAPTAPGQCGSCPNFGGSAGCGLSG